MIALVGAPELRLFRSGGKGIGKDKVPQLPSQNELTAGCPTACGGESAKLCTQLYTDDAVTNLLKGEKS